MSGEKSSSRDHAPSITAVTSGQPEEPFTPEAFVALLAESDWTAIELSYLATNVLHHQGSLGREHRREACSAIRTLQAILKDARELAAAAASGTGPQGRTGSELASTGRNK